MKHPFPRKKRLTSFLLIPLLMLILLAVLVIPGFYSENKRFEKFTENLFRTEVCSSTINLHYTLAEPDSCNISDYPITFGSVSSGDNTRYQASLENHAALLSSFHKKRLSKKNQLTLSILEAHCNAELECPDAWYLQEPLSPSLGIQAQLPVLLAEYTFRTKQDVLDYLKLLKTLPDYFQNILQLEQEKASRGLFMNDKAVDGVIAQCNSFIENPEENYLIPVFNEKLEEMSILSETERDSCKTLHNKLIVNVVIPAYQQLIDGLNALKGSGKNDKGLVYYPNGKSYYIYLLKTQVGTDDSVAILEHRLLTQLVSDSKEMQKLIKDDPSLLLAKDDLSAQETAEPTEILEDLKSCMAKDFPILPETSYEVKYVHEDLQEFLSPAFYLTPPVDTNSPNAIYINPHTGMSGTELYTTLAHEGFPGHLYQTNYFSETNPPLIRHLYSPGGYIEGWATYIESYAYNYADGDPERNRLLWLNRSMNLCLYSIMDVGIHYHGWTKEKTAEFLNNFGIADDDTVSRVYQYILETPANYLKYYYGYLNFLDIREASRKAEGDNFNLKKFHQKILELGPMPFSILKEKILS